MTRTLKRKTIVKRKTMKRRPKRTHKKRGNKKNMMRHRRRSRMSRRKMRGGEDTPSDAPPSKRLKIGSPIELQGYEADNDSNYGSQLSSRASSPANSPANSQASNDGPLFGNNDLDLNSQISNVTSVDSGLSDDQINLGSQFSGISESENGSEYPTEDDMQVLPPDENPPWSQSQGGKRRKKRRVKKGGDLTTDFNPYIDKENPVTDREFSPY